MATTWGTSYFVSRAAAIRYYKDYEDDPKAAVERKLRAGEIHIGVPHLKANETLLRIDGGKRYAIRENPATIPVGRFVPARVRRLKNGRLHIEIQSTRRRRRR